MEQAQLLMWTKRRHNLSPHLKLGNNIPSYDDSWEEQAFARDASGPLGGCIWPPRSYSCSFCKREFRSAQALGGHMNVHRRDRARLKQSGGEILDSHEYQNQLSHIQASFVPVGLPYPSQAYSAALPQNPNPKSNNLSPLVTATSPSRVSAPPSEGSSNEGASKFPSYSSSLFNENCTKSSVLSPQSWPDTTGSQYQHSLNPAVGEKNSRATKQPDSNNKESPGKTDLSVCLNLVIHTGASPTDDVAEFHSCKRRRTAESSLLPFFVKKITVDRNLHQNKEACAFSSSSGDDLDLELRLGGRPKVRLQSWSCLNCLSW